RGQQQLPGRATAFQVLVGRSGLGQWIGSADTDVQRAGGDGFEYLLRSPFELFPGQQVVPERGPGQEQGTGGVEPLRIERWYRAAGGPEQGQRAPRPEAGEAGIEGGLAHAVVDDVDA